MWPVSVESCFHTLAHVGPPPFDFSHAAYLPVGALLTPELVGDDAYWFLCTWHVSSSPRPRDGKIPALFPRSHYLLIYWMLTAPCHRRDDPGWLVRHLQLAPDEVRTTRE